MIEKVLDSSRSDEKSPSLGGTHSSLQDLKILADIGKKLENKHDTIKILEEGDEGENSTSN